METSDLMLFGLMTQAEFVLWLVLVVVVVALVLCLVYAIRELQRMRNLLRVKHIQRKHPIKQDKAHKP
ncbi:hypothetical protein ACFLW6_01825 [Chloroflexota bacterium]